MGNAEPVMLVLDLVLQLKMGTTLLQWNKHKNHKNHDHFVWVLLSGISVGKRWTSDSSLAARLSDALLMKMVLIISRRAKQTFLLQS